MNASEKVFNQLPKRKKTDPDTAYKDVQADLKPQTIKTPYLSYYNCQNENLYFHRLYYEPFTKKMLRLCIVTPGIDDTINGAVAYKIFYQISHNEGKSFDQPRPVVQKGKEFNIKHPIRPVYIPRNSYCSSHSMPIRSSNGEIMCPFEFQPLDKKNEKVIVSSYYPIFLNAGVLIGRWIGNGNDIEWDLGETLNINPEISTRGVFEPALIELKNMPGHFLFIMRGSNVGKPDLPAYKWKSISKDYCRTWTKSEPFTYTDGSKFFSPSSCNDLRRHTKNGKVYWFGNITPQNGEGNNYRYPLIVAEVDEKKYSIKKETVTVIDTRRPEKGDTEKVQFSNFKIMEDPENGDFIISLRIYDFGRYPTNGEHYADHPERYSKPGLFRVKINPNGCTVSDNLCETSKERNI